MPTENIAFVRDNNNEFQSFYYIDLRDRRLLKQKVIIALVETTMQLFKQTNDDTFVERVKINDLEILDMKKHVECIKRSPLNKSLGVFCYRQPR